jgi:hypothetical protein
MLRRQIMATPDRSPMEDIEIPESARETAAQLARLVRELSADLPFGTEPGDFLSTLEALGPSEETER